MRKRILSLLMTLCLVVTMFPVTHASAAEQKSIVYIPLDDRPYSDRRVKSMAASLNYDLIMPDSDLYATRLDGQTLNSNGTQCGDRGALLAWLMEMDKTYDTFILSLDQLLSGGLMNSRIMPDMIPIELPDGTTMTEYQVIDYLAELSQNNELYIIDSVLRLATSAEYEGFELSHYNLFRCYGVVSRPVLTGENLSLDNIFKNYIYSEDGETPAYENANLTQQQLEMLLSPMGTVQSSTPSFALQTAYLDHRETALIRTDDPISDTELNPEPTVEPEPDPDPEPDPAPETEDTLLEMYLKIRERKLRLNDYAMQNLCGSDNVHYLLGVDDSSDGNNIQSNELRYLKAHLSDADEIISTLDGLAQLALSKEYLTDIGDTPSVSVTYIGNSAYDVQGFNNTSTVHLVNQTTRYLNSEKVTENPDVSLLVITESSDEATSQRNLTRLITLLNNNEAAGIPTILADLTDSRNQDLWNMLLENTHLGALVGYSGFGDGPNRVVMALSQGLSRAKALTQSATTTKECNRWHFINIAMTMTEDFAYQRSANQTTTEFLRSMGLSVTNFGALTDEEEQAVQSTLQTNLEQDMADLVENFRTGGYLASLEPYTMGGVENLTLNNVSFPYHRTMEIDIDLSVTLSNTAPTSVLHKAFIDGTTDTTFSPDALLTRDQAAKLLTGALGIELEIPDTPCPEDVAYWAWPSVYTCMKKGYILGYGDGTFRGENYITRGEFATLFIQYTKAEGISLPVVRQMTFTDLERSGSVWCAENVYTLADAGYINGYPDGSYGTDNNISRAEAVVLFTRIVGRSEPLSESLSQTARFTDVPVGMWCFREVQEASISHYSKS